MVLRGVLDAAFGSYISIRGFAPLRDLAKYSKIDESYQRRPDERHVKEVIEFINQGEYLYSPEILLGLPCDRFKSAEKMHREVISLYDVLKNIVSPRHETSPEK